MKSCFIIMPITMPEHLAESYGGDVEHFSKVLEWLIVPAVEKAGLEPILPQARGAELIHARIMRKLEDSDLVLCDMSARNPNVLFELGVRTALAKQMCLIMDNVSERIFDTGMVYTHTYSAQATWNRDKEVNGLVEHIKNSLGTPGNQLWTYFGIRTRGELPRDAPDADVKFDYLVSIVEALSERMRPPSLRGVGLRQRIKQIRFQAATEDYLRGQGIKASVMRGLVDEDFLVVLDAWPEDGLLKRMGELAAEYNVTLAVHSITREAGQAFHTVPGLDSDQGADVPGKQEGG